MTDHQNNPLSLTPADTAAFDRLASEGFDAELLSGLSGDEQQRGEVAASLLGLLEHYPADELSDEDQQTLVDATMARIRRAEDDRRDRMQMDNHPVMLGRGLRFRIAEGLAVAAVIAMATAALWSFGTTARDRAMSAGSRHNLGDLHAGMTSFFEATGGHAMQDAASPVGELLHGGPAKTLNIQQVVLAGYCPAGALVNPRRPGCGHGGFSFAVLAPGHEPHLASGQMILAGDRNPALAGLLEGETYTEAMSDPPWHARLIDQPSVLFSDGHTEDLKHATHGLDGVWRVEQAPAVAGPAPIEIFLAH
jgi:hypothetical protein